MTPDVLARFPRLTAADAQAVVAQRPDATDVRTYVAWLRDGRRVRHGEHGIVLPERVSGVTRARVFDVDQTDPEQPAPPRSRDGGPAAGPNIDQPAALLARPDLYVVTLPSAADGAPRQPMPLATSRYRDFDPTWGVPVRITVGVPRGFRHQYTQALALAPYELFRPPYKGIDDVAVEQLVYNRRLEAHAAEILYQLRSIADRFPGQRAVLLCYENVNAGEACHRRWAADWLTLRLGWHVPEMQQGTPGQSQSSMPPTSTLF